LTARPLQPTEIPKTGFAGEVGLPAMLGMAVLLIVIIILARRLRTA
jgi:LPXTG-motif cell wall-anchored protein